VLVVVALLDGMDLGVKNLELLPVLSGDSGAVDTPVSSDAASMWARR